MGRIKELIPIINIFDWAKGDKYTVDEDITTLTPELAESIEKIDKEAENHFNSPSPAKGGKGKGKTKFTVEKEELKEVKKVEPKQKLGEEKER